MRVLRLAFLLAFASALSAQNPARDFWPVLLSGGPVSSGHVVYTVGVKSNYGSVAKEPYTVRLAIPPGVETSGTCSHGESSYDPATRVLTWNDDLEGISERYCPLTFTFAPSLAPGSAFQFSATLSMAADPNPANNGVSLDGVVLAFADLELQATADPQRFRPGDRVTQTLTMTNLGPHAAADAVLRDVLSPDITFVSFDQISGPPAVITRGPLEVVAAYPSLAPGAAATFRLVVDSKATSETANIRNSASVRTASADLGYHNNEVDSYLSAGPKADLAMTGGREPGTSSLLLPFTINVSNAGPDRVNHTVVSTALEGDLYDSVSYLHFQNVKPSQGTCAAPEVVQLIGSPYPPPFWQLTCDLGALDPGASASITFAIDRKTATLKFEFVSTAGPMNNDANLANNTIKLNSSSTPPPTRRRSVRK